MTAYTDQRDADARRICFVLALTLDQCDNDYTVSPCQATDLGDGARCFYSRETCQDTTNYLKTTKTFRFVSSHVQPAHARQLFSDWSPLYPLLIDGNLGHVQQAIDLNRGFSVQGKLKVRLEDVGGHDDVPDFNDDKTGLKNTTRAGLWWRRFLAIHPNYRARKASLFRGFVTPTFASSDMREIWRGRIKEISINAAGQATVEMEDFISDIEKKLPLPIGSAGTLQNTYSRSATSLVVEDGSKFINPNTLTVGTSVAEVKTVAGTTELLDITSISGNNLVVTRGAFRTDPHPLLEGTVIKPVIMWAGSDGFTGLHPVDVARDLLERAGVDLGADMSSSNLTEARQFIGPAGVRRKLSKATTVRELLRQVLGPFQATAIVNEDLKVLIKANRPSTVSESITTLTDSIVLGSPEPRRMDNESRRLTHVIVAHGYDDDDDDSAESVILFINADTFDSDFYGTGEEHLLEHIIDDSNGGRFISGWDDHTAANIAGRYGVRNGTALRGMECAVEMRWETLDAGDVVDVQSDLFQDEFGATRTIRCQVIERKQKRPNILALKLLENGFGTESGTAANPAYAYMGPGSMTDYDSDTSANQSAYGYLADANGTLGAAADEGKRLI